jgi:hypothetical protein
MSPDDKHRPVSQVDHFVCGAAKDKTGEIASASAAHHDDIDVVLLGVVDNLTGGVAINSVPHLTVGFDVGLD